MSTICMDGGFRVILCASGLAVSCQVSRQATPETTATGRGLGMIVAKSNQLLRHLLYSPLQSEGLCASDSLLQSNPHGGRSEGVPLLSRHFSGSPPLEAASPSLEGHW